MKDLTMDWNKEGASKYEVVPTGTYKIEITGREECKSSKGTPQVRWFAQVQEPEKFNGHKLVDHTPLTETSLWRIARLVKACQIDLGGLPPMSVGSAVFKRVLDCCVGRTTYWNVAYDEEYNNNKVVDYLADTTLLPMKPRTDMGEILPF